MFALALCLSLSAAPPAASDHFAIRVVDEATGRGVPMVELTTTHAVRLWTDSAGLAAFREPGLMGQVVWFGVKSPGYEFAADGFGYRGTALKAEPGKSATLKIRRVNLAERLYRVTGAGIYRDSVLAGREVPLREPLLNAKVTGCDSVLHVVYKGRLFWVWGDTNRPGYVLGNFNVTGATSELPGKGGLAPDRGVDFRYFADKTGFARQLAPMPGEGPTWITSLVVLPDAEKRERLIAGYIKVKPPMTVYARGLAVFDDEKGVFEHLCSLDFAAPLSPAGHAFRDAEFVYFAHPYPLTRVRATLEDMRRPERYEAFTCLKEGSTIDKPEVTKYAWRKNTPVVGPMEQGKLVARKQLAKHEALLQLRDRDTGKPVVAHAGSVAWNAYRKRWVMIANEWGGTSFLGEVWYAEAPAPTGPWAYAVKVATHPKYSFYNPKHHPVFDEANGRRIYFEGTYSHTFSGSDEQTPYYDYNQLMYRLDLGDDRLALPVPVYEKDGKLAYFALDRKVAGSISVPGTPSVYMLPLDAKETPATVRSDRLGGRVWRNPWAATP